MKWECTVMVGTPPVPRAMVTEAPNLLTAKAYFETFGRLLNTPRIINE